MYKSQVFYMINGSSHKFDLPKDFEIKCFLPKITNLQGKKGKYSPNLFMYMFWYIFSNVNYRIYYVYNKGEVVHISHVLGKSVKFPFMRKNDLHVGPSWTSEDFRGRGIFAAVLSTMALDHPGRRLWALTDEGNVGTRRGLEKVGFRLVGAGRKSWGIYRLTDPYPRDR